jgi:hypothetical protein
MRSLWKWRPHDTIVLFTLIVGSARATRFNVPCRDFGIPAETIGLVIERYYCSLSNLG